MYIAAILFAFMLGTSAARADEASMRSEAHTNLMAVARWGMCLVERMGETAAKGMIYPIVGKVDAAFVKKYGMKATDIAQERFGPDFVKRYYEMAKVEHDRLPQDHAAVCARYNQRVLALVN